MKAGKEDMIGILSARSCTSPTTVEAADRFHEEVVAPVVAWGAARVDVEVKRECPSEAGQPMPVLASRSWAVS